MNRLILGLGMVLLLFSGCTELPSKQKADSSNQLEGTIVTDTIQKGNYVTLYYKGTLDDNSVFDQTQEGSPATFQVGVGQLIQGFDNGLLGMKIGEKKTIVIPALQAYGEFNTQAVIDVDEQQLLDANIPVLVGIIVNSSAGNGKIISVDENTNKVKIDFNHPLAGKQLTFEVEILKIDNQP
ncbi:MAG: peptidylprolyl isomerase [Candidatus Diapherotrites archaeon]